MFVISRGICFLTTDKTKGSDGNLLPGAGRELAFTDTRQTAGSSTALDRPQAGDQTPLGMTVF